MISDDLVQIFQGKWEDVKTEIGKQTENLQKNSILLITLP